jgi:hypothetical protein
VPGTLRLNPFLSKQNNESGKAPLSHNSSRQSDADLSCSQTGGFFAQNPLIEFQQSVY